MPARNVHHDAVVAALIADGWTITADPLTVTFGGRDVYVDLAAERVALAAERGSERIAVEVQSFLNQSAVRDLQEAVGQYQVYRTLMEQVEPDRDLYMAVPTRVYDGILTERFGQLIVARLAIRVLVYNPITQQVVRWINSTDTGRSSAT